MKRLLAIALLITAAAPLHAAYEKEYIVVSGGVSLYQWEKFKNPPHDRWWGNFIRPAVTRFQQIRTADPNARITWLVHRPSYERRLRQSEGPLTTWISQIAPKYNVRLIWFSSPDTVINYLNAGQPHCGQDRQPRLVPPLEQSVLHVRLQQRDRQRIEVLAARG
jgi:hypothetical protein